MLAGNGFVTRELDAIQVVGKNKPVHVYELIGTEGDVDERILQGALLFEQGLLNYRKGNFSEAKKNFSKVFDFIPEDPPSIEFLHRIETLDETAKEGDWNGVFKADSKA